ncbi:Protein MLP1 [Mycena sanguinolenta]|uniref:Protein MLP1 n=1 Tax=Mycena sanguinolenta TaxID=230812 RepID=A0A8H6XXH1_9AGAR|nr:Protein MLP1 [Mycena sanguinolenta]
MSMKTRRKSKAAAAAAAEPEIEPGSPSAEDGRLTIYIPPDIDVDALSNLLPETSITTQTPEGIIDLYRHLVDLASKFDAAVRERDEERADVERIEVELDQALQDKEALSKELESSAVNLQAELEQVKRERNELLASQAALQAQISALSTSQSSSSTEVDNLKRRVDDTEREKRDLVGVISRLKQDGTQREEEIQTLRANLKEARQEHQVLESQVRELRSTETSTKFKLESLTQQLQLSQSEAERTGADLVAKSEEYSKYRREKHAELVTLQANFDALTQTHASTQATLKSIQSTHTAQSHQLSQALARVQDLTGQLAEQEATYSSEARGLRRLVSMMEERENKAKEIVDNIEPREAALREKIENERKAREDAEKRVEQLEEVLERMGRGDLPVPGPRAALDLTTDGMMGLSPTVAMVSKAQKSGKTFTEVYTDYVRLQEEFARKCAEYDRMDQTLSNVLAQIEERAPILSQQRVEYERLQSEASHLASQLAQALSDRDSQATLAQESTQKLNRSTRENELLQQQLTDLGRQIQHLLREIGRRDDPSIPSDADIEMLAAAPPETVDGVITNNLVLFQSIGTLQEQNQKLLKAVRELGDKMESEEREYREAMEMEQAEAVREAHEAIQDLTEQLERQKSSSDTIIKAYVKERDALKAMLARVEKGGAASNAISLSGDANGFGEGLPPNTSDMAKELAEMQNQFETYRTEMGVDSVRLREEVLTAQREAGQLGTALAKANAKIEYLSDRHRMSQDQFAAHSREVEDLTQRNQQLFDQWTRLDIECNRATEDLQTANGRIEQLRNECANLRAEKKIWESVQSRLVEENKTLAMERSHLSDLMGNVQKMHNDLAKSGENDRRRLESQAQLYEGQAQELRVQLASERDTLRHISLQKEIEVKEMQMRLDKAALELSKTRETLVGAETSKTHLEQRVEELSRQLQGNTEKLAVYERRSTSVTGISQPMDQDLTREQQLEAEVADLRSALKVAEVDLATARSHVQQFREISQANEAALKSLDATYDEYKTSTEAQIARHQSEYKALQEKLNTAEQELAQFTAKYNELQKSFETERTAWLNDKKVLEDTIVDLGTSEKNSESDRTSRENEVRQLEQRAKLAEERSEQAVLAHAEAIKTITGLKQQLSTTQAAARDHQTAAETASAKLTASESSWALQKDALDKEVSDLNKRQNSLLHQHLESVSTQAARIRQAAESSTSASGEGESTDDTDTKLSELRSVVAYLRKEKEIVDLQLELSKQENARLKTQIEHLSQTLEDTRKTLSDERERAVETAASAAQHAELVERINQLNILRESNATLRTDSENHAKRARELDAKLKQLSAQLNPAKEQARVAQAELEARTSQMARLEEENRKWQERNTQLLSKYDRIDPAEVQSLKDQIEQLKAQVAVAESGKEEQEKAFRAQQERTEALEKNLRTFKESHAKNNEGFRARLGQMNAEKSAAAAEKQELVAKISASDADKDKNAQNSSAEQAAAIEALRAERDTLLAEKSTWVANTTTTPASADAEESKRIWEAEKAELVQARDAAQAEAKEAEKKFTDTKAAHDKLLARARDLARANKKASEDQAAAVAAAIAQAKSEAQGSSSSLQETLTTKHAAELKAALDAARAESQAALDAARTANPDSTPSVNVDVLIAEAIAKHDKEQEKARQEDIMAAVERGRAEASTKAKLKDQQLILAWQTSGVLPTPLPPVPSLSTSTSAPVASAPPPSPASTSAPDLSQAAGKPAAASRGGAPPAARGGAPGPARGAAPAPARGGAPARGAAPAARGAAPRARGNGLAIRGGATRVPPVAAPAADTAASTPAPAAGVSIIGAAKRPREESTPEDSLAKRLKPADPATKPPVQLRRPPPS